jgi:hypothetical protein
LVYSNSFKINEEILEYIKIYYFDSYQNLKESIKKQYEEYYIVIIPTRHYKIFIIKNIEDLGKCSKLTFTTNFVNIVPNNDIRFISKIKNIKKYFLMI